MVIYVWDMGSQGLRTSHAYVLLLAGHASECLGGNGTVFWFSDSRLDRARTGMGQDRMTF